MRHLLWLPAPILALSLAACDKSKPNVELIQDLMDSPAIKSQEYDESSPNHSGMRMPPENTVPQGFQPYAYAKDYDGAIKQKNPIAGDFSEATLETGMKYFMTNCMICHGRHGEGSEKSTVAPFMALKPPPLMSDKIKGWTDGNIYHVITMGQGVMGPYASHIPQSYRWQVVHYIRYLQKQDKK